MSNVCCAQCQSAPVHLICGPCQSALCKACARLIEPADFALGSRPAAALDHDTFCEVCFQTAVQPALDAYAESVARARDINIFYKSQGRETRLIRRTEKLLRVEECLDRNEALMKLAYLAATSGYNTLVDVEVEPRKIRNGGWQSSRWAGRAVPTQVEEAQLQRALVNLSI